MRAPFPTPTPMPSPLSAEGRQGERGLMRRGGQGGEVKAGASTCALVIGLGNALRGDDGIGPAVIETLRLNTPADVTLIESDGHDLLELLGGDEFGRIVVVDAADLGRPPGTCLRLEPGMLGAGASADLAHHLGVAGAVELLQALGLPPAPFIIFAVQPARVGWGPGLSREARRGVAAASAAVRRELCLPQAPRRRGKVLRAEQEVRSLPCGDEAA